MMLIAEYRGIWTHVLTIDYWCRDFAVNFAIFTNFCCDFRHFAVIFYCPVPNNVVTGSAVDSD